MAGSIFCDLKKAFNSVSHDTLLTKLPYYGIRGKAKLLFETYQYYKSSIKMFTNCVISMQLTLANTSHTPQRILRSKEMRFGSPSCICRSLYRAHSTQTECNNICLCRTRDHLHTTETAKFFVIL